MRTVSMLCSVLLMAATIAVASAQKIAVGKVAFRNAGSLPQADLEAVAGFHAGGKVTLGEIQGAAQHLMDTGFFEDVKVDSSGPAGTPTIVFVLKPLAASEMLSVSFENLVWFTPEELRTVVHQAFPLFQGTLPENSNQLDGIEKGLAAALLAQGVAGAEVSHEVLQATTERPLRAIAFRVVHPAVVVNTASLADAAPLTAEEGRIEGKLHNAPFLMGYAPDATPDLLLQPFFNAGFLDAKLVGAQVKVAQTTVDRVSVDYAASVEHGAPYRVSALEFEGSPLLSKDAFMGAAKLHVGDLASRAQLLATTAAIDRAQHRQGYMDAYVNTGAVVDSASHTVGYHFTAVSGEQYRLHNLVVQGLPPDARAQFDLAWNLKPGELYDADYVSAFLINNTAMQTLAHYAGSFQAAADPQTHLVDLTVSFVRAAGTR